MQWTLISYQKTCFGCQIWVYGKLVFEGIHIINNPKIQISKNVYQGV
jgi:hypothetical protein